MSLPNDEIIKQLSEAEELVYQDNQFFPQILDHFISIITSQPITNTIVQLKCLKFIYNCYYLKRVKSFKLRSDHCFKLIDMLSYLILSNDTSMEINLKERPNYLVYTKSIEILNSTYDLCFHKMIDEPDMENWKKLVDLKKFVLSNWKSSYPLLQFNKEADINRNIPSKIASIKFVGKLIQTQLVSSSPAPSNNSSNSNSVSGSNDTSDQDSRDDANDDSDQMKSEEEEVIAGVDDISLSLVPKGHPYLYTAGLDTEADTLIDELFDLWNQDKILNTLVFDTIYHVLLNLFKSRPNQISNKLLHVTLAYESQLKINPKFFDGNNLRLKLIKKYNDKLDKVALGFFLHRGFLNKDQNLFNRFQKKFNYLNSRPREKRVSPDDDDQINEDDEVRSYKKRKLNEVNTENSPDLWFYNNSTIATDNDYKAIYNLLRPNDELANFDLSSLPSELLTTMTLAALSNVSIDKFKNALNIVSDRYLNIVKENELIKKEEEPLILKDENAIGNGNNKDDDDEDDDYDPLAGLGEESTVTTNTNKQVSQEPDFQEDQGEDEDNYTIPIPKDMSLEEKKAHLKLLIENFIKISNLENGNATNSNTIESEDKTLSRIAITNWSQGSWILILSRLATRGLTTTPELADLVREQLLAYLQIDIKNKVDYIIEWLNEEFYNEKVNGKTEHKTYLHYTSIILDNIIPFVESSDRKSFIRLLSELPYLNLDLLRKIKSLCFDPARRMLGIQGILYLIMFRPPSFNAGVELLVEMLEEKGDNDPVLKKECIKYLQKYANDKIPTEPTEEDATNTEVNSIK